MHFICENKICILYLYRHCKNILNFICKSSYIITHGLLIEYKSFTTEEEKLTSNALQGSILLQSK